MEGKDPLSTLWFKENGIGGKSAGLFSADLALSKQCRDGIRFQGSLGHKSRICAYF